MGIVEAAMLAVSIGGSIFAWFRGTKDQRAEHAANLAKETIRYVVRRVVQQLEATTRKRFNGALDPAQARELLTTALDRAHKTLAPQRKKLEKALGIDLGEILVGEVELALLELKADKQAVAHP